MQKKKVKQAINGYVFVCTNNTEAECFQHSLFGSSKAYGPAVLRIKKGDVLFLQNLDKDILYGVYRAGSDGGINIQPEVWNGKYPYQVKVETPKNTLELGNAKKILRKIEWTSNTIINGDRLGYILDKFAYKASSMGDLLIERKPVLKENNNESNDDSEVPAIEATTLWYFPKQGYGATPKGDFNYSGVTPARVIYNLIWKYTKPGDLVVDPMCGSGTTIDVCEAENRKSIGYDISPVRDDIIQGDARKIPIDDESVDMVFIDPPYGDNINYNGHPDNIGRIPSDSEKYYDEVENVIIESHRILKKGKMLAWLIGDQWIGNQFTPVGFKTYERLSKYFTPVDIICVARRGQSSHTEEWINRSRRLNFYLRGFKYLILMQKKD
jgi:DNA modification methylase